MKTKNKQNTKRQGRICRTQQSCEKKKRRTRARRKRKELILETLEARKGPRQINEHRNKQMIMRMRKDSGEITSDREEIRKKYAQISTSHSIPCNGPRVMQRRDRQEKNSTCNLTTLMVHVSGVFTQRTQISPLTLDVTTTGIL